jgi:hypothetical protein
MLMHINIYIIFLFPVPLNFSFLDHIIYMTFIDILIISYHIFKLPEFYEIDN